MIKIAVAISVVVGSRIADAFADAEVIELVAKIRIGVRAARAIAVDTRVLSDARQRRQHAEIGQIAGGEQHRAFFVLELGQLAFERIVDFEIAAKQPRFTVADAVALKPLLRGRDQARARGQCEVIVAAEGKLLATLGAEGRTWQAFDKFKFVWRGFCEPGRNLTQFFHLLAVRRNAPVFDFYCFLAACTGGPHPAPIDMLFT